MGNASFSLLSSLAGLVVYLYLLNHHLFAITDGSFKVFTLLFILLLLVFLLPTAVYVSGPMWPLPHLLSFIFLLTILGEIRRYIRRKRYVGKLPSSFAVLVHHFSDQ